MSTATVRSPRQAAIAALYTSSEPVQRSRSARWYTRTARSARPARAHAEIRLVKVRSSARAPAACAAPRRGRQARRARGRGRDSHAALQPAPSAATTGRLLSAVHPYPTFLYPTRISKRH